MSSLSRQLSSDPAVSNDVVIHPVQTGIVAEARASPNFPSIDSVRSAKSVLDWRIYANSVRKPYGEKVFRAAGNGLVPGAANAQWFSRAFRGERLSKSPVGTRCEVDWLFPKYITESGDHVDEEVEYHYLSHNLKDGRRLPNFDSQFSNAVRRLGA